MIGDDDVRRILDVHADALSILPNVVGVGIVDGALGESAVAVYVSRKVPQEQLPEEAVVPKELGVDDLKARTRVIEVGEIRR
ncbi:MAG TPA: hypothetical protein VE010_10855 [Thermoanaerobaculia bacterium]|nr:hypothetical protein [Thermoanaerobaculia bacterium]